MVVALTVVFHSLKDHVKNEEAKQGWKDDRIHRGSSYGDSSGLALRSLRSCVSQEIVTWALQICAHPSSGGDQRGDGSLS